MVYLSQRLGNKTQNPMVNHKWFPLKHIQQHIWDVLHLWTKPFVYPSNSRYSTFFRFSKDRICQWGRDKWSQLLGQYFDNPNWWFLMKPLQLVGKSWQVTTIASAAGFVWKYTWKSNGIMFIFWFKRIIWVFFSTQMYTGILIQLQYIKIVHWGCNRCSNRCSNSAGHSPMFWECHVSHHRTQYLGSWPCWPTPAAAPSRFILGLRHGIAVQRWSRQNSEILTCAISDSRRTPQNHHVYLWLFVEILYI
jgi:hypothetical protein